MKKAKQLFICCPDDNRKDVYNQLITDIESSKSKNVERSVNRLVKDTRKDLYRITMNAKKNAIAQISKEFARIEKDINRQGACDMDELTNEINNIFRNIDDTESASISILVEEKCSNIKNNIKKQVYTDMDNRINNGVNSLS